MATHYNAFISYRHHPEDIKVAEQLHRALERYKPPKDVRKKTERITRIFRDKDELPITSNLTDDITSALENSDYLIVICSSHTKESVWVQREIETFLKTHSRSKVLTVLIDDEPYHTIPQILLQEEVTDPESGEKRMVDVEPLSCDWRIKRNRRDEFLRLAAALLGCRYDELRQRQRQYRMRRLIAVFSVTLAVSLCLMAYFIYTSMKIRRANERLEKANVEIQNNLEQSLLNQSKYLSSASQERLEAGDRLTAMYLALEALPQEGEERPYLTKAEQALAEAVGLYSADGNTVAVGMLSPGALVRDVQVSADGKYAAILDARGQITIWDTYAFERLAILKPDDTVKQQMFMPNGNLLVQTSSQLICATLDGQILWQLDNFYDNITLAENTLLATGWKTLEVLDITNGQTVDELQTELSFGRILAASGNKVVTAFSGDVCLCDLQTKQVKRLMQTEAYVDIGALTEEGNVLISVVEEMSMNGDYGTVQVYSPQTQGLYCFDGESGAQLWHTTLVVYRYSAVKTLEAVPAQGQMLYQYGNSVTVFDNLTGLEISKVDLPANPVIVKVYEDCAKGLLEDGSFFKCDFEDSSCMTKALMESGVQQAAYADGYFAYRALDMAVTVYRPLNVETAERLCDEEVPTLSAKQVLQDGSLLLVRTYDMLVAIDTEKEELLWTHTPENAYYMRILGISEDQTKLWLGDENEGITCLDVQTGRVIQALNPFDAESTAIDLAYDGQWIYFTQKNIDKTQLVFFDPETEEKKNYTVCKDYQSVYIAAVTQDYVVLRSENTVYLMNRQTNAIIVFAENILKQPCVITDDQQMAISIDGEVRFVDGETFSLGEKTAVSGRFYGEELLILCDDGALYRYDLQGNQLSKTELHIYNTFYTNIAEAEVLWDFTEDGELILNVYGAGNIISCRNWERRANLLDLLCYLPQRDELVKNDLMTFRRHTTQEVIALAQQELGSFELTSEEKEFYGID